MNLNESIANALSKLISTISEWAVNGKKSTLKGVLLFFLPFLLLGLLALGLMWGFDYMMDRREAQKEALLSQNMDHRIETSHILDSLNTVLQMKMDADRVMTAEFHDDLKNTGGSDCLFFSERHEVVNSTRNIPYVTLNKAYDDRSCADYPIIYRLKRRRYFIGSVEDMRNIDRRYANRMEEDSMGHCGVIYFHLPDGRPLLMLSASWRKGNEQFAPSEAEFKDALYNIGAQEAAILMYRKK